MHVGGVWVGSFLVIWAHNHKTVHLSEHFIILKSIWW